MFDDKTNIRAISLDLYQTLVDIDSCRYAIIKEIFPDGMPREAGSAEEFWSLASGYLGQVLVEQALSDSFLDAKSLFLEAYKRSFEHHGITADEARAATILSHHHGKALIFDDVAPVLASISKQFPLFLTSDADDDFLGEILPLLPRCFTGYVSSESVRSYKIHPSGTIWHKLISMANCSPTEIVHIGDGISDILGAKRWGLRAIWLNRRGSEWARHDIIPDAEIRTLSELLPLLGF